MTDPAIAETLRALKRTPPEAGQPVVYDTAWNDTLGTRLAQIAEALAPAPQEQEGTRE
jgi:hypothetical protein